MADTVTHSCVVQAETLEKFLRMTAQLDAYQAANRRPAILDRNDNQSTLRITYSFVETLNLDG